MNARPVHVLLHETQSRIEQHAFAEMAVLDRQLEGLCDRMSIKFFRFDFNDKHLRITHESFGYGEEPTVNVLSQVKPGAIAKGATVIISEGEAETMPLHDYQVARIITPNVLIPPPAAARMFGSDADARAYFTQLRGSMYNVVDVAIKGAMANLYNSEPIIPYDYIGSATMIGYPAAYVWRNLPGDLVCFRCEFYMGLTVLPKRAVLKSAIEEEEERRDDGR